MVSQLMKRIVYNKYSTYLKKQYGVRVHRVSIDTGFSCPGPSPCIYCNNSSFNHFQKFNLQKVPLKDQIETGLRNIRKKFKAEKFILYFQSGTNTNADIKTLAITYDLIRGYDDFVGLNIATRPDVVNDQVLSLIAEYKKDYQVCIEYGLQSIHDKTLDIINRGHGYQEFLLAYQKTKELDIAVCVHLILGLPFEIEKMILATAAEMTRLKVDAVKLHPMHIIKDTVLALRYKEMALNFLDFEEYRQLLASFLANLSKDIVVYGLNGYAPEEKLVAPSWISIPNIIVRDFEEYLLKKGIYQGMLVKE
ncbi:MAG: TIGR01212 family radical SAM protein [bacterium]|nr:TIGR01212 family radical SAM protein [bacterium]